MTRTSCLGTANALFKYLFDKKVTPFVLLLSFCWTDCQKSTVLDYFWDISRDWERLQGSTTLHGRL